MIVLSPVFGTRKDSEVCLIEFDDPLRLQPFSRIAMAQNPLPELYLSLLSGRYGDVSHISTEKRRNDIGSRISGHPFPNDPDRLTDLLDALAAVCVRKEKGDVFFVSLAMGADAVTLYVSSNETVPPIVPSHLRKIRGQLKELRKVTEPHPSSISADNKTYPDPNDTPLLSEGQLNLHKTIYKYSYSKLRRRFFKRAPTILAKYKVIMTSLRANKEETIFLRSTQHLLLHIRSLLEDERPSLGSTDLIETIHLMSRAWRTDLKGVGDEALLTRWDNSIRKSGLKFRACGTIDHLLL